jgi:hypothetical protein
LQEAHNIETETKLKNIILGSLAAVCATVFISVSAMAVNPNGFPSGEHFNLNIHGKKDNFSCPAPYAGPDYNGENHQGEYGDYKCVADDGLANCITWEWKYSGSIFIPVSDAKKDIQILMESGKSGGKGKKNIALSNVLKVTDPCSADFDNDAAVIELPPNENGYRVYARALATPTDDPSLTIEDAGVNFLEDGSGNVLYFLGSIDGNSVDSTLNKTFTRTKGKSKATDIASLFEFSGDVCYLDALDCPDEPANPCFEELLCCADLNEDLIYDICELREDANVDGVIDSFDLCTDNDVDGDGNIDDFVEEIGTCKHYESEWVFNIADFVQYFWNLDNNGLKLLQIRFYPN